MSNNDVTLPSIEEMKYVSTLSEEDFIAYMKCKMTIQARAPIVKKNSIRFNSKAEMTSVLSELSHEDFNAYVEANKKAQ